MFEELYITATKAGFDVTEMIGSLLKVNPQELKLGIDAQDIVNLTHRFLLDLLIGFSLALAIGLIHNSTGKGEPVTIKSPGLWAGTVLLSLTVDGITEL